MDYKKRLKIWQSNFSFKNKGNLVVQILDYSEKVANFAFFDFVVQRLNYKPCSLRAAMDWWLIVQRLNYKASTLRAARVSGFIVQRLNYKTSTLRATMVSGFIIQRLDYKKNRKINYPKKLRNLVVQRLNYKPCIHWGSKDCGFWKNEKFFVFCPKLYSPKVEL